MENAGKGLTSQEQAGKWLRVSSGGQDEANQEPDIDRHCSLNNYNVARTYTLHGKSASKGDQQPYLDQVISDIRAGVIKVLVIWHSDRIERRPGKALLDVLAEISAAGGRVESVQEPALGQLDFGSQVTTFIAGLVNHEKSAHLSAQVKLAQDKIRANMALNGRPPFGYTMEGSKYNRQLVPTELGREYVPQIFARVVNGETLASVARWLQSEKVPTTLGKSWWPDTVRSVIRTKTYVGRRENGNGVTIHECDPLIDAVTFNAAGKALDNRPKRGPVNSANRAMLAGAIWCPRCEDSPMYRIKSGKGNTHLYYRCTGRGADRHGCGNMVQADKVDTMVNTIFAESFDIPVMVRTVIPGSNHDEELAQIKLARRNLAMQDLDFEEEDAKREELRAEYARVAALPNQPEKVTDTPTGESYLRLWDGLETSERGAWLVTRGFTVTATREALTVAQGPTWETRSLG